MCLCGTCTPPCSLPPSLYGKAPMNCHQAGPHPEANAHGLLASRQRQRCMAAKSQQVHMHRQGHPAERGRVAHQAQKEDVRGVSVTGRPWMLLNHWRSVSTSDTIAMGTRNMEHSCTHRAQGEDAVANPRELHGSGLGPEVACRPVVLHLAVGLVHRL